MKSTNKKDAIHSNVDTRASAARKSSSNKSSRFSTKKGSSTISKGKNVVPESSFRQDRHSISDFKSANKSDENATKAEASLLKGKARDRNDSANLQISSTLYAQNFISHDYQDPSFSNYGQWMGSQSQSQLAISLSHHPVLYAANPNQHNLHSSQAPSLLSLNNSDGCVCGMLGQPVCTCGFSNTYNGGIPGLIIQQLSLNNPPSLDSTLPAQSSSSYLQPSFSIDNIHNRSLISQIERPGTHMDTDVNLQHPESHFFHRRPSSSILQPDTSSSESGRSKSFGQYLFGAAGVDSSISTDNPQHSIVSSSTISAGNPSNDSMDLSNLNNFQSEPTRWNAIVERSHLADSHFIYGSRSTRIYCRPSCPSKRPDRTKVTYFTFPEAALKAERAGHRACKRCKPGTEGVADVCVLAVGECLRQMARAAILGESQDVDKPMKKKTLRQYSSDFGVSQFHFHRTLKKVSTMTPGEYGQACQDLVLQDELGIDWLGRPLKLEETQQRLRGWSTRRARKALGNVSPMIYSSGMLDCQIVYIIAENTPYGCVVAMYGVENEEERLKDDLSQEVKEVGQISVVGLLIGDDAIKRALIRCPRAVHDPNRSQSLLHLIDDLYQKGTREVQMPAEVIPWLRRARSYLAVKRMIKS